MDGLSGWLTDGKTSAVVEVSLQVEHGRLCLLDGDAALVLSFSADDVRVKRDQRGRTRIEALTTSHVLVVGSELAQKYLWPHGFAKIGMLRGPSALVLRAVLLSAVVCGMALMICPSS